MLNADELDELQRDSEVSEDGDEAVTAHIRDALLNVHTMLPGIILSFSSDLQTAQVQPAIQRIFTGKGAVNLPVCIDVPVAFPGGGDYQLTFPVKQGDECTLSFSERCIDFWFENGGVQLPAAYRMHDYSDAFANVGVNSKPKKLSGFAMDGAHLRTRDGSAWVKLKQDGTVEAVNGSGKHTLKPTGAFKAENDNGSMTLGADGSFGATNAIANFMMNAAGAFVFNGLSFTVNAPVVLLNSYTTVQGGLGSAAGTHGDGTATFSKPVIMNDKLDANGTVKLEGTLWRPHNHNENGAGHPTDGVNP